MKAMENTIPTSRKKQPLLKVIFVTLLVVLVSGGIGFLVGKAIYYLTS